MLRTPCILLAIMATVSARATVFPSRSLTGLHSNKTASPSKDANDARSKAKTVTLCLSGVIASDVGTTTGSEDNIWAFYSEVFDCIDVEAGGDVISTSPKAGAKKLGDLGFSCTWAAAVQTQGTYDLAPCTGLLTIQTTWNKHKRTTTGGTTFSTASIGFWGNTTKIVAQDPSDLGEPIGGIVSNTNGAWPKPDVVRDYTWQFTGNPATGTDGKFTFTINYKKRAWNPAA